MSRILRRPLTLKDMIEAKAVFMAGRERQKNDKKRTKRNRHKALGGQGNTDNLPLIKGEFPF